MDPLPSDVPTPPTTETLRDAALAAYAARRQAEHARRLAEARAELPKRAAEYLGGLVVTPELLDGEDLVVDGLRFRLAPSGALAVLLPCPEGTCAYEFADLAGLGELLTAGGA